MRSHPVRLSLFALMALGLIGPALAQRPEDGEIEFEKRLRVSRIMREQLRKGELSANPKEKEHVTAIDDTARTIVYPLYWRTIPPKPEAGKINAVVDDFVSKLADLQGRRPNTNPFIQLLCKEVIVRCVEIIQHPRGKPIAGINAARILATIPQRRMDRGALVSEKTWIEETQPRLADGNAEFLAETCLTLIADPKMTDGHRYWLYRCLASLLSLQVQTPSLLKVETVDKILVKSLEQIAKKVVFPKATPRQEVEGYKMLRQQAVIVLASARRPTVGDKGRPILVLARIAGGDTDITPAPRLSERVEAAIGLAHMGVASAKIADVQMDYVMGAIVSTVIEFGKQGNGNLAEIPIKRQHPWKVDAIRLSEALDELKLGVKAPRYVPDAIGECQSKVLSDLEKNLTCKFNELADWPTKPTSKALFKSDPTTTIKGVAAAPE